jgi:hypothetical protein
MKAETLMYKTILIEQELLSNYIHNSNEYKKDIFESYLSYIDSLQFTDITKLKNNFQYFYKSIDNVNDELLVSSNCDDHNVIIESEHNNNNDNNNCNDNNKSTLFKFYIR